MVAKRLGRCKRTSCFVQPNARYGAQSVRSIAAGWGVSSWVQARRGRLWFSRRRSQVAKASSFSSAVSAARTAVAAWAMGKLPSGATYIYSDTTSDILFLRLNSPPPQGAFFAGWNPNAPAAGAAVVALHHPEGDLLKVSQGTVQGFTTPDSPPVSAGTNEFTAIQWNSGVTEPGSSGSGIFTSTGGQYVLRGALWGGGSSCSAPAAIDAFSRFDLAYSKLVQYLSPPPSPSGDFTDLWWNPAESGWGLNVVEHPTHVIFAVWYTYGADRRPTWYVLPSGAWTSANVFSGTIYATSGPPASGATFNADAVQVKAVGSGTVTFSDANNGTFAFTIDGVAGTKAITRQPF